jgi:3-oxoacyl-[acyl-carrier-protein] synthase-3
VEASKKALEMANVDPQDIDLLLLCTSTPDDLFGSAPQVTNL